MADVTPAVVKRLHYFDGQFLQEPDFTDEQVYQLDREHRHNRLLHGAGIAGGLTVTSPAPNQVTVAPGTAIDSDGHQIVLAEARTIQLPVETFNGLGGIDLYLSYRQELSNYQDADPGGAGYTRWWEHPDLTAIPPGGSYSGDYPPVPLARLTLDGGGNVVTIDNNVRSYSGLLLPGPGADPATLRATSKGPADLAGSLTVDGSLMVGTGTAQPSSSLHVNLPASSAEVRAMQIDVQGFTGNNVARSHFLQVRDTGKEQDLGNYFIIKGNGRVGVGTASPGARLDVVGDGGLSVDLLVNGRLRSASNDGGLWVSDDRFVGGANTNQIGFWNGGFRLVVLPNGNVVGIGTDNPENSEGWSRVLDVAGSGNAKLSLRTGIIDARVQANQRNDSWNGPPGMMVGTKTAHPLNFGTSGAVRMTITSDGKLGLGTTGPASTLHLYTPGSPVRDPQPVQAMSISVKSFGTAENSRKSYFLTTEDIDSKQGPSFVVRGDGAVGIGKDPGDQKFYVAGNTYMDGVLFVREPVRFRWMGQWKAFDVQNNALSRVTIVDASGPSDIRLKTEVRPVSDALNIVANLRGIRFRWSDSGLDYLTRDVAESVSAGPGATDEQNREAGRAEERRVREALAGDRMGLVAQDLEAVAPELVFENEDGYKHIRYQQLTAVLVEAVKEQDARVRSLSAKVAALQLKNPGRTAREPEGK
jgi:hypothetical protein